MLKRVDDILNAAARVTGFDVPTLLSASKAQSCFEARAAAIYLCRNMTRASYPELSKIFHRHHTSVLHSFVVFSRWMEARDERAIDLVETIKQEMKSPILTPIAQRDETAESARAPLSREPGQSHPR